MLKYSIILPCYNVSKYLLKCLKSIEKNDLYSCEIILVDDGSTDDTIKICNDFINNFEKNDNVKFNIISKPRGGVSSARNVGLASSNGEYIIFIDPDDEISPNLINKLNDTILQYNSNLDMIMYGFWRINVDSLENVIDKTLCLPCKEYRLFSNEEIMSEIFPRYIGISIEQVNYWAINSTFEPKHEWGSCWRVAYKRQFLIDNDIRFNEHIILNEDSMFNANALVYASSIVTINEGLYNYYIRKSGSMKKALSNSLVDNKYALFLERKRIVELIHNSKINYGFEVYAGSIVFGIIEMMSSANFREWKKISNILKDKHIKECIKKMPYVKNKKFSFSLFFIKNHMPFLLFIILFVLKKFGVNIKKNI